MTMYGDVLIRTTRIQIEEFQRSILWKDMKRELGIWMKIAKDDMMTLANECVDGKENSVSAMTRLGSIQGRIQTIQYVLGILDNFKGVLEEQANARRNQTD